MFSLKYERIYHQHRAEEVPPPAVKEGAERQIQHLHPERTHELTTINGTAFRRAPLASSEGWIVTYTPTPAPTD